MLNYGKTELAKQLEERLNAHDKAYHELVSTAGLDPFYMGGQENRKAMFAGHVEEGDKELLETIRVFQWQQLREHSEIIRAASKITAAIEQMAELGLASAVQVALEGEFGDTLLLNYNSDIGVRQQVYSAVKAFVITTQVTVVDANGIIAAMKKTHREDLQKKREFYYNGLPEK
jgi:hypothetical protein